MFFNFKMTKTNSFSPHKYIIRNEQTGNVYLHRYAALKVVRNSFPFSITTELYERFTRL